MSTFTLLSVMGVAVGFILGLPTNAAEKCKCSRINAESVATGTCSMGEDSSSFCRMEWNGGGTGGGQSSQSSTASTGSSSGQSGAAHSNRQRYVELSLDGGRRFADALNTMDRNQYFGPLQARARSLTGNINIRMADDTPGRIAAAVINSVGGDTGRQEEVGWAVIYLAAYTYYPFTDQEGSFALARALRQSIDGWRDGFVRGNQGSADIRDPQNRLNGSVYYSKDCLMVVVGNVHVMVKGPRSLLVEACR